MSDWPDGWTDNDRRRAGGNPGGNSGGNPNPEGARVMPHVQHVPPPAPPGPRSPQHDAYGAAGGDPYNAAPEYNEGQVYRGARRPQGPQPPTPPDPSAYDEEPRERRWPRRVAYSALALVIILVIVATSTFFWADSKLRREVDLSMVEDRPESGEGTNYLIVGSDSREGLSEEERNELHTGDPEGQRTDTMVLLHVGDNGNTMISLPRDSLVTIPAFTGSESGNRYEPEQQKLNTAYSYEGPWLLVRTVEYNLDIRIDHYMEIGFGGFANVVDALGGVEMCFDEPVQDENSGADFDKGCHNLNGAEALAFNRQRYQEAEGDLGRTRNQQEFLGTISDKMASMGTILNPFRLYPTLGAGLDSLIVDKDMSLWDLRTVFYAMRDAKQMNIPVENPGHDGGALGSTVLWDEERTERLMNQIRNDEKITVSDEVG
ncbi:LCP family protein [Streptomyces sp. 6N223]|uniref:LCP family protein n=1 Tax=Streptomyces sp. 6N223 TaxID=3457412 RepID=UPI003FD54541